MKKQTKKLVFFIFLLQQAVAWAQLPDSTQQADSMAFAGHFVNVITINNMAYPCIHLGEVTVLPPPFFKSNRQRKRYTRLMYKIKKVYPYSQIIRDVFLEVNRTLDTIPTKRKRKEYIKLREADLKKQFEHRLKKLTYSEGRILIKLVDRETGHTTYQVVKQLKGSVTAFFWQGIARIFGSNLKSEYDSEGDDWMIEDIVRRIEAGQL